MLSIIIPSYNHNDILPRAVQSALNQKIEKEIIIVDDGSANPIVNSWGDPVRVIRHEVNKNLPSALNTGIEASIYDRFVILAADDMLDSRYGEIMFQYADKADIISCDFVGQPGRRVPCKPGSLEALKLSNCHSYAALIKKSLWKKVGGFKVELNPSWEDWEFFLNCAKHKATWFHVPLGLHIYHRNEHGRDVEAQGKDFLLRGKFEGFHTDLFGQGQGLVTFIIPCYNQEAYLPDALESVFSQIYPHVNAVVVDDESPGNVVKACKDYQVSLVRQKNRHLSGARNAGVMHAIKQFNSQYLVMLDADDKVSPDFVEKTLSNFEKNIYVYTDVQFFGDASHVYTLPDFDCKKLVKKHLHSCTFLMESSMWKTVVEKRGYGYDEKMKQGYEDWEFALACVEAGFCGKRLREPLFYYRNHKNGSMRTEASKIDDQLAHYIRTKHIWMKGDLEVACATCGGNRYAVRTVNKNGAGMASKTLINIPGIGEVDGREPLQVMYTGPTMSTMTKLGRGLPGHGNAVYKYSGNPNGTYGNIFNIFAIDAHLFNGSFQFRRIQIPTEVPQQVEMVQAVSRPRREDPLMLKVQERLTIVTNDPDDLTLVTSESGAQKLQAAGLSFYSDILKATDDMLIRILGKREGKKAREGAERLMAEKRAV